MLGVGHPMAYAHAGLKQKLLAWYTYYFLLAGISDRLLQGDSALSLTRYFQHPRKAQVLERLRRPGRMTAALRIYRANVATILLQRHPTVSAPTLGIWAEGDRFLVESQMTRSEDWVSGPWRYERFPGDHWTPIGEASHLNQALLTHLQEAQAGA